MEQAILFAPEPERENAAVRGLWVLFGRADATCRSCAEFTPANATEHACCRRPEALSAPWRAWYTACGRHRARA